MTPSWILSPASVGPLVYRKRWRLGAKRFASPRLSVLREILRVEASWMAFNPASSPPVIFFEALLPYLAAAMRKPAVCIVTEHCGGLAGSFDGTLMLLLLLLTGLSKDVVSWAVVVALWEGKKRGGCVTGIVRGGKRMGGTVTGIVRGIEGMDGCVAGAVWGGSGWVVAQQEALVVNAEEEAQMVRVGTGLWAWVAATDQCLQ
eukprot:CAMPEP_0172807814 /NCGR_PEP_ID=MMETSP1075-20121228/7259_1 /TAXON_ID=2916 /ORGANISM="Ceratium fusus, Strain PA161109" /LENGTH=202 /DNA_ID=CAMNT_0013646853 /DNA_START=494 /DNA_END=1105 /DNA_ORIENTATION=+